jgi:sugar phosphate isomerase/epimerase
MSSKINRRHWLQYTAAAGALSLMPRTTSLLAAEAESKPLANNQRYKIAACDWMMLKRQKLGAIQLAKDCGLDGVEVDMGSLGATGEDIKNELRKEEVRQQFLDASHKLGVEICSLALSAFYGQSYAEHPKAEEYTAEFIELMPKMGVKVGFLPLGVRGDLKQHPEVRPMIVERLKRAGPLAEKAGVIVGIETTLDAMQSLKLLDDIGSPAVQIYYNPQNTLDQGYDLYAELKQLGPQRICQFHFSDKDGVRLGEEGCRLNVPKCKQVLDDIGWRGWLVIERSRKPPTKDVKANFSANCQYLKSVFQTA